MQYSVLIVEDEKSTREALCNYFPWASFDCKVIAQAENGIQALNAIRIHNPDIVLCDIKMPVMSGLELAKTVFEENLPGKIVFLSGYRDFDLLQKAMQYGARNYILKPTKYDELAAAIQMLKQEIGDERAKGEGQTARESMNDRVIREVKQYVQGHLQYASLDTVSSLVHMSPSYFSQYFKKNTGENFLDFLIARRMEKAAQLLLHSNMRITEISEIVGYSSSKAFSKMFGRVYHISPRDYRNGKEDE